MLAPTFLFYRTGFAPTNGTSVQMQRIFNDTQDCLIHILWDAQEGGGTSGPWTINTDDRLGWKRPLGRLASRLEQLRSAILPPWWQGRVLNKKRLRKALAKVPLQPRRAYAVCYKEDDAAKIVALWDAVGQPPLVLHIMDILNDGLSSLKTPNFALLVNSASHILCLNKMIQREAEALGGTSTSIFPLCSDLASERRSSMPPLPLKIIISGALYADLLVKNRALDLIVGAWDQIVRAFPGAELHYAGISGRMLPSQLQSHIIDHGFLSWSSYQELLNSCHLAYVPVSHGNDNMMRFSLPSRIPDYLISGLPVLACTEKSTGIDEFFQTTPADCTKLVETSDDLLSSIQTLAGDEDKWKRASDSAIDFSNRAFAVGSARETLFSRLDAAEALSSVGAY